MIVQNFYKSDADKFGSTAYKQGNVWRWWSNEAPVPLDAAREYGIPIDPAAQQVALDAYYSEVIAAYRESRKGGPSAEERAEARAAHGSGVQLVDIITGRKFTT